MSAGAEGAGHPSVERASVEHAAEVVWGGGVLIYPTETVYGIGCNPYNTRAVDRVRAVKGREAERPMLALTDEWYRVESWLANVTAAHRRLMQHDPLLPVTLLFEASAEAPPGLVSASGEVGLRRTPDPFCRALVAAADVALLSTSANRAGHPAVARFADLDPAMIDAVDLAVDAGHALGGTPSTVVRIEAGRPVILREGAVEAATLRAIIEA